jgi:hypothetical protein
MKKLVVMLTILTAPLFSQSASRSTPARAQWKALDFLIGTWEAKNLGGSAGAAGSGLYSFRLELGNSVLARHSNNNACKGPVDFDCDHGDLLYVYKDASDQPYKAIYFDNEGHVIHYEVSIPKPGTAIFLSGESKSLSQYRLIYELKGSTMFGKFQMRPPGKAEFTSYLEWSGDKEK